VNLDGISANTTRATEQTPGVATNTPFHRSSHRIYGRNQRLFKAEYGAAGGRRRDQLHLENRERTISTAWLMNTRANDAFDARGLFPGSEADLQAARFSGHDWRSPSGCRSCTTAGTRPSSSPSYEGFRNRNGRRLRPPYRGLRPKCWMATSTTGSTPSGKLLQIYDPFQPPRRRFAIPSPGKRCSKETGSTRSPAKAIAAYSSGPGGAGQAEQRRRAGHGGIRPSTTS